MLSSLWAILCVRKEQIEQKKYCCLEPLLPPSGGAVGVFTVMVTGRNWRKWVLPQINVFTFPALIVWIMRTSLPTMPNHQHQTKCYLRREKFLHICSFFVTVQSSPQQVGAKEKNKKKKRWRKKSRKRLNWEEDGLHMENPLFRHCIHSAMMVYSAWPGVYTRTYTHSDQLYICCQHTLSLGYSRQCVHAKHWAKVRGVYLIIRSLFCQKPSYVIN